MSAPKQNEPLIAAPTSDLISDLDEIHDRAASIHEKCQSPEIHATLDAVLKAVGQAEIAHSQSWIGYQSCVYYEDFKRPPGGAIFDKQYGLEQLPFSGTRGNWVHYNYSDVFDMLRDAAEKPNLEEVTSIVGEYADELDELREEIVSVLEACIAADSDAFLERAREEASHTRMIAPGTFAQREQPQGQAICRDYTAVAGNMQCPPHVAVRSNVRSVQSLIGCANNLAKIAIRTRKHLERRTKASTMLQETRTATKIFIGHGHSPAWRELKDYIQETLGVECDEFNRQETAGQTTQERLAEMLNDACFAFLVMTAEDEQKDGTTTARLNVVHEVGLFQGRLGFGKAIVMLENGCEQFSNIHGLTHIPFERGKIEGAFHRVHRVLKREGIMD